MKVIRIIAHGNVQIRAGTEVVAHLADGETAEIDAYTGQLTGKRASSIVIDNMEHLPPLSVEGQVAIVVGLATPRRLGVEELKLCRDMPLGPSKRRGGHTSDLRRLAKTTVDKGRKW